LPLLPGLFCRASMRSSNVVFLTGVLPLDLARGFLPELPRDEDDDEVPLLAAASGVRLAALPLMLLFFFDCFFDR
jgi:hypothetical protein